MNDKFRDYLAHIGLSETLTNRVEEILEFYTDSLGLHAQEIFISEHVNEEGVRQYNSLWLFNDNYIMEAENFVNEDNFDCFDFNVRTWTLRKESFIYGRKTDDNSRLYLELGLGNSLEAAHLRASRENCEKLMELFVNYILPKKKLFNDNHIC